MKLLVTIDEENKILHARYIKFKHPSINPALQKILERKFLHKQVNYTHEKTGNNLT